MIFLIRIELSLNDYINTTQIPRTQYSNKPLPAPFINSKSITLNVKHTKISKHPIEPPQNEPIAPEMQYTPKLHIKTNTDRNKLRRLSSTQTLPKASNYPSASCPFRTFAVAILL